MKTSKHRNPFAIVVMKRKAGSHRKSNKALRKKEKQRDRSSMVEQGAFNAEVVRFESDRSHHVYLEVY